MTKDFDDMTAEEKDAWADAIMADILEELGLQDEVEQGLFCPCSILASLIYYNHKQSIQGGNCMSKPTMYAVVDYPINNKDEVASAFFRTSVSAEMAIYETYTEARDVATDILADGSDEVAIIPIKLDIDNVECVYNETIVKTVKLKK